MSIKPFSISRLPRIHYGHGEIKRLPSLISDIGKNILIITGKQSFISTSAWPSLTHALEQAGVKWQQFTVANEPSPSLVDDAVKQYGQHNIELVVAIGGGSVLDAAKAIAGLLPHQNSVMDYLEGVGKGLDYNGPALPFIAVPTTAGTGSEATKNAVLSEHSANGFKKSFRHECLVAEHAIIDPELLASCPTELIAADGMDAFTQLLESYVSSKANPMIDALAWSGLEAVNEGFIPAWQGDSEGLGAMAYAAMLSGITLAQVGLGSVHGLASPLGAFFPIPHGVVCGTLVAAATQINIQALQQRDPHSPALRKYAEVGRLLSNTPSCNETEALKILVNELNNWTEKFDLPRLNHYGIQEGHFAKIVANSRGSSMMTNPIRLEDKEITAILKMRL